MVLGVIPKRLRLCGLISALLLVLMPGQAFAIADPDSITLETVQAYSGVLEAGDLLVVVHYDLAYTTTPTEQIADAYFGRFFRGTTELNAVEPFPFNDRGYGVGIFSLYWTASQVTNDSIEFEDTNSESYSVSLQGKVGVFPGSAPSSTTNTITWRAASNTEDLLFADIAELANTLEQDAAWVVNSRDLIDRFGGQEALTSAGETYFASAIPNLQVMIPDLFSSAATTPTFIERDHERVYSDRLQEFWAGTWVDTRFVNLATTLRMPKIMLTTMFAFTMMMAAAAGVYKLSEGTAYGLEFSIMSMAVSLVLWTVVGFVSMEVTAMVTFFAVLGLGWVFLRPSRA